MFEQTSRLAEKLAASVSRRGFLGSLGGWAAAAALGVAGGWRALGPRGRMVLPVPAATTNLRLRGRAQLRFSIRGQNLARKPAAELA